MTAQKKLKDFMIDAHIPRRWRDRVPLVEANGKISWVVGWRIADWAKVTASTRARVEISFERTGQVEGGACWS
jgi:tRNA(Ile)-lysidine synthase